MRKHTSAGTGDTTSEQSSRQRLGHNERGPKAMRCMRHGSREGARIAPHVTHWIQYQTSLQFAAECEGHRRTAYCHLRSCATSKKFNYGRRETTINAKQALIERAKTVPLAGCHTRTRDVRRAIIQKGSRAIPPDTIYSSSVYCRYVTRYAVSRQHVERRSEDIVLNRSVTTLPHHRRSCQKS